MARITDIEGIGPALAETLRAAGIPTTDALLTRAGTAQGRKVVGEETGLDASRLLRFVSLADLMRIRGVGREYAELLEAAGVDGVPELARRRAEHLHAQLVEVNAQRRLVRQVASEKQVEAWIGQAASMAPAVTY